MLIIIGIIVNPNNYINFNIDKVKEILFISLMIIVISIIHLFLRFMKYRKANKNKNVDKNEKEL